MLTLSGFMCIIFSLHQKQLFLSCLIYYLRVVLVCCINMFMLYVCCMMCCMHVVFSYYIFCDVCSVLYKRVVFFAFYFLSRITCCMHVVFSCFILCVV